MDHKKNHIIFYCRDLRCSNFSRLVTEGASGTISSMLWLAEGLAKSHYKVTIVNSASNFSPHIERGVSFIRSNRADIQSHISCNNSSNTVICVGVEYDSEFISSLDKSKTAIWFWHHNPIIMKLFFKFMAEEDIQKHIFVSLNHALRHIKINSSYSIPALRKAAVIYNPLDFNLLSKHKAPVTNYIPAPKIIKVAYVGNTSNEKGYNHFRDLINKLSGNSVFKMEWHVFGGGLYENSEKFIGESAELFTHGTVGRDELYRKIKELDFIACGLGENETFCVAGIEAAFLGKKIITSGKGGQLETLANYEFKINIKKIDTITDLVNAHRIAISEIDLTKFRAFCMKKYSIDSVVTQWIALIDKKSVAPCFLGNINGTFKSIGLYK